MEIKGRNLEFNEDTHTHYVDGERVDSVTQILHKVFPSKYADIPKDVLKKASERGTQVHKAIEAYCKGFDDGSDEVKDFKFLRKNFGFIPIENEIPLILDLKGKTYAGTADLIMQMNGLALADIKTTSVLDKEYLVYQLNLYRIGLEQSYDYKIESLYGIHLRDGKRKLVPIPMIDEDKLYEMIKEVL